MSSIKGYLLLAKLGLVAVILIAGYLYINKYKVLYLEESKAKAELNTKYVTLQKDHTTLQDNYNTLKAGVEKQNEAIAALQHDNEILDQQLADANSTISTLKKKTKGKVNTIMAGVDDTRDCKSSIRGSISRLKGESK